MTPNDEALQAYIRHMHRAGDLLARLTEYVEDMGNVLPDEVNYTHVGDACLLADDLAAIAQYALETEEVA